MTRALLLALGAIAALVSWAVVAWLRRPQPEPDPADDVQPVDPMTLRMARGGPAPAGATSIANESGCEYLVAPELAPYLTGYDPTYLEAIAIRSTQTGPIGPSA